jgi:hypothetical protein
LFYWAAFCGTGKGLLWQATGKVPGCERALYIEARIVAFDIRDGGGKKVGKFLKINLAS